MKLKTLFFSAIAAVALFTSNKAVAFPLTLTSLTGTITSSATSSTNRAQTVAVTLKQMFNVISNEISIQTSGTNAPPAKSKIVIDPFTGGVYVTNTNGYFFSLSGAGLARVDIDDIATSYHQVGENGGVESDVIAIQFWMYGRGTDGLYYEYGTYGRGRIAYAVNSTTGRATMTITATGTEYGQYKNSYDGVCTGAATFTGASNSPEWEGPYSVYWWSNN